MSKPDTSREAVEMRAQQHDGTSAIMPGVVGAWCRETADLLRALVDERDALQTKLRGALPADWIEDATRFQDEVRAGRGRDTAATLRALLRCGAWELKSKPDVPREIVIDEYVELAKAFFDEAEAKFVNAALDGVARDARD
jgi:hypothetical protein